jgi:hypothetical protein
VGTTRPAVRGSARQRVRSAVAILAVVAAGTLGLTIFTATPAAPSWTQPSADAAPTAPPQTVAARPKANTLNAANGEVRALAQVGNRIYLGGTFTKVGPAELGAAGVLQTGKSAFTAHFPDVVGVVFATAPDGHGGWYLGGQFSSVGGVARHNLAHVSAQGRVTGWNPRPDAPVRALAHVGRGLVVAGDFTHLAGQPAAHIARLGLTKAHVQWTGGLNDDALSLALSTDRQTVYVGGSFTLAGSAARSRVAAYDVRSGRLRARFHPAVDAPVRALAVLGSAIWLGGDFGVVAGQARHGLASVTSSGTVRRSPRVDGSVLALAADRAHHRVFLGGSFNHVGGRLRPRFASVASSNGRVGAPRLNAPTGDVRALAVTGGNVYLAGDFQLSPAKTAPGVIARLPIKGHGVRAAVPFEAVPASMTRSAQAGGGVFALAAGPRAQLLVAGDFSDYGLVARRHLAAVNADTGALDRRFRPKVDGPIYTLKSSPTGSALFLGGAFRHVDGAARKNLARIGSARGGLDTGFHADANAFVKDMAVSSDGRLYVAGPFVTIDGSPARHLAAVSASSGHVLGGFDLPIGKPTNNVSDGVRAIALSPDGATLAVVGNFGRIGSANRPLVALVNVAVKPAMVRPWRTTLYNTPCGLGRIGFMRDVTFSSDGSRLFVVSAGGFSPPACDVVNAFPVVPNGADVTPLWTARVGDSIETVVESAGTVYIGGHFRVMDRATWTDLRYHIAALDEQTGRPLSWAPDANGFRGVRELALGENGSLLAGSDGTAFGQAAHGRIAVFAAPSPGLSVRLTASRSWLPPAGGDVTFDVTVTNTTSAPMSLTGLTDSRLGSLDGRGTCGVPASVGAHSTYDCRYTVTLSGAAGAGLKRVVTAVTAGDVATDETKTQFVANVPAVLVVVRTAPAAVPRRGGRVLVGVTLTNLDPIDNAVVKTLTSSLWGNVSGLCALPKTLSANKSLDCQFRRRVSGTPGHRVRLRFTASGTVNSAPFTSTAVVNVKVSR